MCLQDRKLLSKVSPHVVILLGIKPAPAFMVTSKGRRVIVYSLYYFLINNLSNTKINIQVWLTVSKVFAIKHTKIFPQFYLIIIYLISIDFCI